MEEINRPLSKELSQKSVPIMIYFSAKEALEASQCAKALDA